MQRLISRRGASSRPMGLTARPARQRVLACQAKLNMPDWLPAQAVPVLEFFNSENFELQQSDVYKSYLKQYVENEWVAKSTGFKAIPELINGRAAMLGFLAGAGAELFGAGSVLRQLSSVPQPAVVAILLIAVGTMVPIVKGTEGGYLDSLKDTYSLPEGWFTEANERVHGRLAMVGLGSLVLIELLKGTPLL